MKLLALAAALAMTGSAAFAQDTQTTTPPQDTTTTAPSATAPAAQGPDDPVGGYQPSTPPLSGQPQPGQKVIFRPNPQTPTEAFPPPPPLQEYPICKKGQTDNCRQRGG